MKLHNIFILIVIIIVCSVLSSIRKCQYKNIEQFNYSSEDSALDKHHQLLSSQYWKYVKYYMSKITTVSGSQTGGDNSSISDNEAAKHFMVMPSLNSQYCSTITNNRDRCKYTLDNIVKNNQFRIFNNLYDMKTMSLYIDIIKIVQKGSSDSSLFDLYIKNDPQIPHSIEIMLLTNPIFININKYGLFRFIALRSNDNLESTLISENTTMYKSNDSYSVILVKKVKNDDNRLFYDTKYDGDLSILKDKITTKTPVIKQLVTLYYFSHKSDIFYSLALHSFTDIDDTKYTFHNLFFSLDKKNINNIKTATGSTTVNEIIFNSDESDKMVLVIDDDQFKLERQKDAESSEEYTLDISKHEIKDDGNMVCIVVVIKYDILEVLVISLNTNEDGSKSYIYTREKFVMNNHIEYTDSEITTPGGNINIKRYIPDLQLEKNKHLFV